MDAVQPDDAELVREFQAGFEQAFNKLALRHRRGVYMTALGIVGNHDDAEEITQEVFVKAYGALGEFRRESAFYTWIYRITVNLSLNLVRRRKIRSFLGLDELKASLPIAELPDEPLEIDELSHHARKAIAELPEKQRAVFILRHFRQLSNAEIAQIMNRDEGTIKANYFQAIRKLRKKLGPYMRGEE